MDVRLPRKLRDARKVRAIGEYFHGQVHQALSHPPGAYSSATAKCKQFSDASVAENGADSVVEIRNAKIRRLAQLFCVTALDEDGTTTCGARAIDIAPAVAYDITCFRIKVQLSNCAEDQAWPWLTAIARLAVILTGVIANLNTIN